jgi:hypothetical protein
MQVRLLHIQSDTLTNAEWREPRGAVASVHHEIARGQFVTLSLSDAGILIRRAQRAVGIPLENLLAVAAPTLLGADEKSDR